MTEPGIYIRDVNVLEQFASTMEASGQTMSAIDQQVCNYLNSVRESLERQLDYIQGKLQEAKMRLEEAEQAANACHASQMCIEGVIIPSCMAEESAVMAARTEVEDWTRRHTEGTRIFAECQREIGEYQSPEGGHGLITDMSGKQTPDATRQLRECFEKLQNILQHNAVIDSTSIDNVSVTQNQLSSDKYRVRALKNQFKL